MTDKNKSSETMEKESQKSSTQSVLLGEIDVSAAGKNTKMYLGDINGDGRMEIVMVQPDGGIDDRYVPHQVQSMTAFDLDGNQLWQVGDPDPHPGGPGSDYPIQIYDIDGDGALEILCVMEKEFFILDGKTGDVKSKFSLPADEAHDCIIIANLTGSDFPQDIILKDRYQQLWAMDKDFHLLWTHQGNPGHFPWVFDFNADGKDEVMAGYDFLSSTGEVLWSCEDLDDHADCIWVGNMYDHQPNDFQIVVGGSVTVMYDKDGNELWRYTGSVESQHVSIGNFRDDIPGLQVAGLDRIIRGDEKGKDGIFLLDNKGNEIWKEDRKTKGWLTIIETIRNWDDHHLDYILAYRRGGGIYPTLYDGYMNPIVQFPVDGYVVHADLLGTGNSQVIVYDDGKAFIYGNKQIDLSVKKKEIIPQEKRLYSVTLYPGGEYKQGF